MRNWTCKEYWLKVLINIFKELLLIRTFPIPDIWLYTINKKLPSWFNGSWILKISQIFISHKWMIEQPVHFNKKCNFTFISFLLCWQFHWILKSQIVKNSFHLRHTCFKFYLWRRICAIWLRRVVWILWLVLNNLFLDFQLIFIADIFHWLQIFIKIFDKILWVDCFCFDCIKFLLKLRIQFWVLVNCVQ